MELREFLSQRQQELNSETTNILLAGQVSIWSDSSLLSPSLPLMDSWCQIARVVSLCMATIAGFPAHYNCWFSSTFLLHAHPQNHFCYETGNQNGWFIMDVCLQKQFGIQQNRQANIQATVTCYMVLSPLQFGSSSDGLEVQSSEAVGEMLGHVTQVLDLLTNSRTQHLFLIKGSPR